MTSDAIGSTALSSRLRANLASQGLELSGWLFAILATLLFLALTFLGLLTIASITYSEVSTRWNDRAIDIGWATLSLLALFWGLLNLNWLRHAITVKNVTAAYGHLALAIGAGLIALGTHFVLFAHTISSQPIVLDYSDRGKKRPEAAAGAVAVEGDADEGRAIFSTTCVTCHGPAGGGMPNLAPSLRGSPFIASADAAAIADVIRLGRAVNDPNNKTKKVMPARGGNPFLGDDKISHLVAFVQAIQNEEPGAAEAATDPNAPPPVVLSKWVVPAATGPPAGMIRLTKAKQIGDAQSIANRSHDRKLTLVRTASLGLTGVHCLMLVGVLIVSSNLLFRELLRDSSEVPNAAADDGGGLWSWLALGWGVTSLAWLFVFLVGFVMT